MAGFNHFPEISLKLHEALKKISRDQADLVVETYQSTAARATGYMAESAYVVTATESTYGQGMTPPDDVVPLPEIARPDNDIDAYVSVAAPYAGFLETGTRFMPAQPAFFPAIEAGRASFEEAHARLESELL